MFCIPHPKKYQTTVNYNSVQNPPPIKNKQSSLLHPSFPFLLVVECTKDMLRVYSMFPSKTELRVLLSVNTSKSVVHSEALIYTMFSEKKSLVNTFTWDLKLWLLLALIECTQKESDFSVIKVSSLYFPWHVSPGQMATTCHRPKKGQHSSRAIVVNIYHGSLKKDRENNLKLISVCHVNVVQGKASLNV